MPKKKKKEKLSWKERRSRAALKHQQALRTRRLKRETEQKESKGWSRSKVLGIGFLVLVFLVIGVYAAWQGGQPSNTDGSSSLYTLTDAGFTEFRGKVVVIDCFATFCEPCKMEIPYLTEIDEEYDISDVVVVSVGSKSDSATTLRQFKQDYNMTWRVARDTVGVFNRYNVEYIPTLVILDQDGNVHFRESRVVDAKTLSSEIDALLGS